jgi:hypothetical protein
MNEWSTQGSTCVATMATGAPESEFFVPSPETTAGILRWEFEGEFVRSYAGGSGY